MRARPASGGDKGGKCLAEGGGIAAHPCHQGRHAVHAGCGVEQRTLAEDLRSQVQLRVRKGRGGVQPCLGDGPIRPDIGEGEQALVAPQAGQPQEEPGEAGGPVVHRGRGWLDAGLQERAGQRQPCEHVVEHRLGRRRRRLVIAARLARRPPDRP